MAKWKEENAANEMDNITKKISRQKQKVTSGNFLLLIIKCKRKVLR